MAAPEGTVPLLPYAPQRDGTSGNGSDPDDASDLTEALEAADGAEMAGGGPKGTDPERELSVGLAEAVHSIGRVAAPFFAQGGARCWRLAVTVLVFLTVETGIMIKISKRVEIFQDALKGQDAEGFWACIHSFGWWIAFLMVAVVLHIGSAGAFSLEWRKFLTASLLDSYISDSQAYYRLKMLRADVDNPDQRIGQDVGEFTGKVVPFFCQMAKAVMTILSMSVVLFMVSPKLFLVLVFGSLGMVAISVGVFGAPLMRMQRTILSREASLRFVLVRVREHAESIAFYRGAGFERGRCAEFFGSVILACYRRLFVSTAFTGFHTSVTVFMHFLPAMVMAPDYFDGKVDFGSIGRANMLFTQLMASMTLLASQLEDISNLGAQAVRVRQLQESLLESRRCSEKLCCSGEDDGKGPQSDGPPKEIELQELPLKPVVAPRDGTIACSVAPDADAAGHGAVCLRLNSITLVPPRSITPVVRGLSLVLREGQSLMIAGPSGAGKSSLLRAIGGFWASGRGSIERCHIQHCFFAPQVPYLCMGTLRENSAYPCSAAFGCSPENDARIKMALRGANIGYLAERHGLDREVNWDDVLSGGEKQRLGFARLLLREGVHLAFMDESTSAMDPENEDRAYEVLRGRVPCFVSVGHRPNLERFHTHKLALRPLETGGCEGQLIEL